MAKYVSPRNERLRELQILAEHIQTRFGDIGRLPDDKFAKLAAEAMPLLERLKKLADGASEYARGQHPNPRTPTPKLDAAMSRFKELESNKTMYQKAVDGIERNDGGQVRPSDVLAAFSHMPNTSARRKQSRTSH